VADSLAQFPEVMDAVIDPSFFGALPQEADLAAGLERSLGQASSHEDFLDRIRIFAQEHMFLIGTRVLSGTVSAEQAGEAFARLADLLIRSLYGAVVENFVRLHGRVPCQETAILALGKLGGREDDRNVRSRPDRGLRLRSVSSGFPAGRGGFTVASISPAWCSA